MFKFEKFDAIGGSYAPRISIRNNGVIGFSQGALRAFKLDSGIWFAELYFDKDTKTIGIKPTSDPTVPGVAKINRRDVKAKGGRVNQTASIACRAFLDYFGISFREKSMSYVPRWDEDNKMILVDVSKAKD